MTRQWNDENSSWKRGFVPEIRRRLPRGCGRLADIAITPKLRRFRKGLLRKQNLRGPAQKMIPIDSSRLTQYKNKGKDTAVTIRKDKREDLLSKRRNINL
ncbi:hypothetical protein KIN20_027972, partial [Parelaphostrongylus tenuis]